MEEPAKKGFEYTRVKTYGVLIFFIVLGLYLWGESWAHGLDAKRNACEDQVFINYPSATIGQNFNGYTMAMYNCNLKYPYYSWLHLFG